MEIIVRNKLTLLSSVLAFTLLTSACQQQIVHADNNISASTQTPKYPEYINSGEMLPLKSIQTIDGKEVDLASTEKQKLVILFATWCSDSNRLLKALNQDAILQNPNIEVIAIAREEDKATVTAWRDEHDIKVALATDADRSIFKQFAEAGIPRIVTVSNNNQVIKMNLAEGQEQLQLIDWQG